MYMMIYYMSICVMFSVSTSHLFCPFEQMSVDSMNLHIQAQDGGLGLQDSHRCRGVPGVF